MVFRGVRVRRALFLTRLVSEPSRLIRAEVMEPGVVEDPSPCIKFIPESGQGLRWYGEEAPLCFVDNERRLSTELRRHSWQVLPLVASRSRPFSRAPTVCRVLSTFGESTMALYAAKKPLDGENFRTKEIKMRSKNCSDTQFACSNGRCIPMKWVCDHQEDCPEAEDEKANCQSIGLMMRGLSSYSGVSACECCKGRLKSDKSLGVSPGTLFMAL
ncbi:unnamed protein product [Notodromas monacha]|uniref:Uncharacterized protein n=1 Tax=Notodromas monacha TaxID=399045 RepID=A0A7R9BDT6_9CRUS|nr:unnamed protein product [Notodromas monacha]CAG0913509.1 unnamed protein product [Notodromas monacha]